MKLAYVDTSCLVAIAFQEAQSDVLALACGLYIKSRLADLAFITLDARQNALAASLESRTR